MNEDQTLVEYRPEDEAILPEGWDGESDVLSEPETIEEELPTTEEPIEPSGDEPVTQEDEVGEEETETDEAHTTEPEAEEATAPPKIKFKYNHQEQEMSTDEAALWVQKGMHHDKISPVYDKAVTLAKQMGYESADALLTAAADNFIAQQVQELVDEGVHEAVAETVVRTRLGMLNKETVAEVTPSPEQEAAERQAAVDRDIDMFVKTYPGVTKVPDEVLKTYHEKGVPLVAAYAQYEANLAKKELKILKQNQTSAAKAPLMGVTHHGNAPITETKTDPFLEGFDSDRW